MVRAASHHVEPLAPGSEVCLMPVDEQYQRTRRAGIRPSRSGTPDLVWLTLHDRHPLDLSPLR